MYDFNRYGNSTKPISPDSWAHSKLEWSKDILFVVATIFGEEPRIIAFGHDRGARVAYRLASDFTERVKGAACLDIVPTIYVWDAMRLEKDHSETMRSHHWVRITPIVALSSGSLPFLISDPSYSLSFSLTVMF